MLPVVGEEVLVGFEHDDTRRPYVLGSLFSGKDQPGTDLLQGKDGSFALKSDTKILLQSTDAFTLKTGANLVVEVTGDVSETIQGGRTSQTTGKTGVKATQALELEGQSVTVSGMTALELKCGAASIQLSSAGVTISGPMITIG
jgi:uncharacterized protein involved in type VI secretion and phage assembly